MFPDGTLPHPGMSSIESVGNIHNNGGIVSWSESISSGRSNLQGMYADSVAIYRSSEIIMIEVGSFVRFMEGQEFNAPATIRYLSLKVVEINGDVAIITLLVDTKDVGGFQSRP